MTYLRSAGRVLAHYLTWPWCTEHVYMDPDATGWKSAIRSPWFGTVAFRRLNGRLSHRW